jgi:hypothetical protein
MVLRISPTSPPAEPSELVDMKTNTNLLEGREDPTSAEAGDRQDAEPSAAAMQSRDAPIDPLPDLRPDGRELRRVGTVAIVLFVVASLAMVAALFLIRRP